MRLDASAGKSIDDFGSAAVAPGLYHVMVKNVDESMTKYPSKIVAEFEVLSGTTSGQEHKTHTEWFSVATDGAMRRVLRLALALGLLRPGEEKDVSFGDAIGKQIIIEIEQQEYEGKKYLRIAFMGMWPIDHPDVRHVPLHAEMLKLAHGQQQAPTEKKQEENVPAAAAATAKARDDWDDVV
jgi:hypothetical protein